jgi:hypothetical protein
MRQVKKADRPETLNQANRWERIRRSYLGDGLCEVCASQAAWGHQLGFGFVSARRWPEADRRISPPCKSCAPIVATFPVDATGSGWRRWEAGDRRPVPAVGAGK